MQSHSQESARLSGRSHIAVCVCPREGAASFVDEGSGLVTICLDVIKGFNPVFHPALLLRAGYKYSEMN